MQQAYMNDATITATNATNVSRSPLVMVVVVVCSPRQYLVFARASAFPRASSLLPVRSHQAVKSEKLLSHHRTNRVRERDELTDQPFKSELVFLFFAFFIEH